MDELISPGIDRIPISGEFDASENGAPVYKKVRVLFVASAISGGGAERVIQNVLNSLPPEKYEVVLAITSQVDSSDLNLRREARVIQYDKKHAYRSFPRLSWDLIRFKPDFVFVSQFTIAYFFPLFKLLSRMRFKVIVRIAVPPSDYPLITFKAKLVERISGFSLKHADVIVAQTESMKNDVVSQYCICEDRVKVVPNIVDDVFLQKRGEEESGLPFQKSCYNIVASGALYSVKGFDLLIEAVADVRGRVPELRLYIIGGERYEAGYRDKLQASIDALHLDDCIFLLGHQRNPYPYYKAADLFVMSSIKEGFPNVVLESLFYGTPVVATDCVDFTGIIEDGVNGFVVKRGSSEALAHGIAKAHCTLSRVAPRRVSNRNFENIFV